MSERGSRHTAGEGAAAEGPGEEVAEEDGAVVEEHLLVVQGEGEEGGGPEGPSVGEAGDGQEGEAQADPWGGGGNGGMRRPLACLDLYQTQDLVIVAKCIF